MSPTVFLVLFMSLIVLFQLPFTFIYSTFSKKNLVSGFIYNIFSKKFSILAK